MSEPEHTGSKLLDAAVAVLLAAMALWGAVGIVQAIWWWLCAALAMAAIVGAAVWVLRHRGRRW